LAYWKKSLLLYGYMWLSILRSLPSGCVCCETPKTFLLCSKCTCVSLTILSVANTWVVRKVFVHFEYLENRSRALDVTWQLVREDLTTHPWTVTLPWG
jgi:hypothetical protein